MGLHYLPEYPVEIEPTTHGFSGRLRPSRRDLRMTPLVRTYLGRRDYVVTAGAPSDTGIRVGIDRIPLPLPRALPMRGVYQHLCTRPDVNNPFFPILQQRGVVALLRPLGRLRWPCSLYPLERVPIA